MNLGELKHNDLMEVIMNSVNTQENTLVMREARQYAYLIEEKIVAMHNEMNVTEWSTFPREISVKESNRKEVGNRDNDEMWEIFTTLTFRFEGGTVIRLAMKGESDGSWGSQWIVEKATVKYYDRSERAPSPWRSNPKKEFSLKADYFQGKSWNKKELPLVTY